MPVNVKMSFTSSTTTGDRTVTTTTLYTDVSGTLELDRSALREATEKRVMVDRFFFYPERFLTGIVNGVKATGAGKNYTVEFEETFEDHQEIFLRLTNP